MMIASIRYNEVLQPEAGGWFDKIYKNFILYLQIVLPRGTVSMERHNMTRAAGRGKMGRSKDRQRAVNGH